MRHGWIIKTRRNNCTRRQRDDKKKYLQEVYKEIEKENDTSKLFKTTRNLLGWNQPGGPSCLKINGITHRKQKEIANCQMEFYIDKIQNVRNKLPKVNIDPLCTLRKLFRRWIPTGGMPKFELKSVTEKEVGDMINNLKKSHAFGIDKFDAFTIKMAAGSLIPPIAHIINLSLSTGHFPARWKLARILPLLKGKEMDRYNPSSYRPVSQLPVIAKLAERAVQRQVLTYLEDHKLLSPQHHAYRDKHNTTSALLHLMDSIATATDRNWITATMNIDLTAAFDCVPHGKLMNKLEFYGFDECTLNWIRSYLSDRSSFVSIGSAESDIKSTPQGVPQGSVFGPLLYLIFVNEMTSVVEDDECLNPVHMNTENLFKDECLSCGILPIYADDGQFQISGNNRNRNQDSIENIFWVIKDFLNANGLLVNESKTRLVEFMSYQKRTKTRGVPPDLTIQEEVKDRQGRTRIQDKLITDSGECKMLGLRLKNSQTWDAHLNTGYKAVLPGLRRQIGPPKQNKSQHGDESKIKTSQWFNS